MQRLFVGRGSFVDEPVAQRRARATIATRARLGGSGHDGRLRGGYIRAFGFPRGGEVAGTGCVACDGLDAQHAGAGLADHPRGRHLRGRAGNARQSGARGSARHDRSSGDRGGGDNRPHVRSRTWPWRPGVSVAGPHLGLSAVTADRDREAAGVQAAVIGLAIGDGLCDADGILHANPTRGWGPHDRPAHGRGRRHRPSKAQIMDMASHEWTFRRTAMMGRLFDDG